MFDSVFNSDVSIFVVVIIVVGLAALVLYLRDRYAAAHGQSMRQAQARFAALMQFYKALQRCIPGVLIMICGVFLALDRSREHDPEWPLGLLLIPLGWLFVWLLARKSWRRYLDLQRQVEGEHSNSNEHD